MQIVKQKHVRRIDASATTTVEEYLMNERAISGATAIISGRYPNEGFATNTVSKELVLVLSGGGAIGWKGKELPIELGDCILIQPKEKYYWKGHLTLFMACTPTWKPTQHKVVQE